jgi:hypothetical protein
MLYIDLDDSPDVAYLQNLSEDELSGALGEALDAGYAAEEWSQAAADELVRRRWHRTTPLFERLHAAERRRLQRRGKRRR